MSSSRSDDVTKSLCMFAFSPFFQFKAFKALEARYFKGVTRVSKGWLKDALRLFHWCFKSVERVLQSCFKEY